MKTREEIDSASKKLCLRYTTPGISDSQKILIMGMVNALGWVADSKQCDAIEDLLNDRPIAIRQPASGLN